MFASHSPVAQLSNCLAFPIIGEEVPKNSPTNFKMETTPWILYRGQRYYWCHTLRPQKVLEVILRGEGFLDNLHC